MKKLIFYFTILLSIVSCKHEVEPELCKPIIDYQEGPSTVEFEYITDSTVHRDPCFNPTNANEIIFYIQGSGFSWPNRGLVKYNLNTRKLDTLLIATFWSRPRWSSTGWIIFGLSDMQIWKIKDNGDSLTQVTTVIPNFDPFFTNDPTIFVCDNDMNSKGTGLLMTLDGEVLDTLHQYPDGSLPNCNTKNVLISQTNENLVTYKIGENTPVVLTDGIYNFYDGFNGAAWLTDSTFIWANKKGVYTSGTRPRTSERLFPTCDSRFYGTPIYARSINKVIWTKLIYDQVDGKNILHFTSRLVMMNPDGTDEEEIDIPR